MPCGARKLFKVNENYSMVKDSKELYMLGREATAWKRKQRAEEAVTCLKLAGHNLKSGPLIDVGCGLGYLTRYFLDLGIKAIGVDISKENVKVAKKVAPNGSFILVNGVKLPFRDEWFTTVILNDVLEHVPYDLAHPMLNEIRRILKADGKLYISVANRYQIREPHTLIPFLTWLPKPCWDPTCRLIRKYPFQDYSPYTIRRLERICREVGLIFNNYTWFYARNKMSNTEHIGDPTLNKLVEMIKKLKLSKLTYVIAEKVSVILFICEKGKLNNLDDFHAVNRKH
jgi:SAM-dependent methyltransferase